MTKNILVFPSTSEIGHEVIRSLRGHRSYKIIKKHSLDPSSTDFLPGVANSSFYSCLTSAISQESIDIIYPAHDLFVDWLDINRHKLPCQIVLEAADIVSLCRSKTKTYLKLQPLIRVPTIYHASEAIHYPAFCKPDKGYGSNNAKILASPSDLDFIDLSSDLVISEYLPGAEFTVDCVSDIDGQLKAVLIRKRLRIVGGITKTSVLIDDRPDIVSIAKSIADRLLIRGAWFFQLKESKSGEPCLLEVAPRISGNMALLRANGVNPVLISILTLVEHKAVTVTLHTTFNRLNRPLALSFEPVLRIDTLYIDLDDTIIVGNVLFPPAIALLCHCKNIGVSIVLITRHSGNLFHALDLFHLRHFFAAIHHITDPHTCKSSYIISRRSIFVDDSYKERNLVYSSKQIPVFSVDMLDSLVNCIELA
jgi:hypothetical protein